MLICGTGSNSAGVNPEGRFFQCGGFTYPFGDFGGGGSLCIEAFRTVIRAWDGRERPTLLTRLVLDELGYGSVQEMFDDYLDHNKVPPLRLAKLLFTAAKEGDEAAADILRGQGIELGKSAQAVIRRLAMETLTFDVVLAGSIVTRGEGDFVHQPIREAVKAAAPAARVVTLEVEPVVGAVWMAVEATGIELPSAIYERLRGMAEFSLA